jgi:hypothetical protein
LRTAIKDEAGTALPSVQAAKLKAAAVADELARDGSHNLGFVVIVVDENGNDIAKVPVVHR